MPASTAINGPVHLSLLQEQVKLFTNLNDEHYFQHNGTPCHKAKLVSTWLQKKGVEVVGPWPGNSPDLNPIENCWNYMKDRVVKLNPTSVDNLT